MRQITPQQFLDLYEQGFLSEVVSIGTTIYARNVKGQGDNPKRYEIVYTVVP